MGNTIILVCVAFFAGIVLYDLSHNKKYLKKFNHFKQTIEIEALGGGHFDWKIIELNDDDSERKTQTVWGVGGKDWENIKRKIAYQAFPAGLPIANSIKYESKKRYTLSYQEYPDGRCTYSVSTRVSSERKR